MKRYSYRVYDSSGNYVTTWEDVASELSFSEEINGGLSPATVLLPRGESDYGENVDVKLGNVVKIWCADKDSEEGVLVYSGYISRYVPMVDGHSQYVEVTLLSFWTELERYILEDSGSTEVAYTSEDPSDILTDLLDKFAAAGGHVTYGVGTIEATGTTVSYTFNTNTYQEAIKKVLELCPDGWYLRLDADGIIHFAEVSDTADHTLAIGKHLLTYKPEKRTENMVNRVYFRGGDPGGGTLYKKYERSGSIASYGLYSSRIVDERVTVEATMDIMATRVLDKNDLPEIRITLKVLDNNNEDGKGIDIESIHVGDTVSILGVTEKANNLWDEFVWDVDSWDFDITNSAATVLPVQKKEYSSDYCTLEISNRQPDIAKRIEDIARNLTASQTVDNPSTPDT